MELEAHLRAGRGEAVGDFDGFFRAQFPGVARAASLVARDLGAGQDAAQESFARLFARWHQMESKDHARNFAYRVAINLARSHVRKLGRVSLFGLARPERATEDPNELTAGWLEMVEALAGLSRRQRACVVLIDYADMDAASVARILGMGTGTVRVHLMRGRRALRERLGLESKETS
jgi:RNA polymerase sigma-70 factor (ECF subfamily)